jgi:hypothetical protein
MHLLEDKPYGMAMLAEGILENLSREDLNTPDHMERSKQGQIRLPDINFLDILKREIDKELERYEIRENGQTRAWM